MLHDIDPYDEGARMTTTDVLDDASAAADILAIEAAARNGGKDRSGRHAPPGFNPAAVFLLGLAPVNLFEPIGRGGTKFRCKGCGDEVSNLGRDKHHAKHRRDSEKPMTRTTTNNPAPPKKETTTMANDKPKVSKTKTARETAIRVLKAANKPMLMADLVAKVIADPKVKAAGIPERTIQAQVNFELQEKSPVILRVDRGVYAHKDAADKKPPVHEDAPKKATTRQGTGRKTGAAKKTTAKSSSSPQARPDPKPKRSTKKTTARSTSRSAVAA